MIRADRLESERAMVLVIDMQEKLLPLIHHQERVLFSCRKLLDGAGVFGLPVVATEQYPKGIGSTEVQVRSSLRRVSAPVYEKATFSACGIEAIRDALRRLDRPQIIVTGIETHVCVQQSTLDLRVQDYDVFVCADAVGARGEGDHRQGLSRMRQAGAVITTVESVLFELCGRCDTDRFKALLEIIKSNPPGVG